MKEKLKPCPFCGQPPHEGIYGDVGCVNDDDCPVYNKAPSSKAWNTRPIEDALRARLDEAEVRVADLERAAKSLVNSLPDAIFDWSGAEMGWSNVSTIKLHRDKLASLVNSKQEAQP